MFLDERADTEAEAIAAWNTRLAARPALDVDLVEKVARAIDEACIAYSKSHAGLNLRKWDTPGEVMALAAIAAIKDATDAA